MPAPILAAKLFIPPPRSKIVLRPRLVERLNGGLSVGRKLTLISAPAGFGKTTLAGEWVAGCGRPAAWLSLDEGDSDPARFLTYLIAALQTLAVNIGAEAQKTLQSPQPLPIESILTALLNEIAALPDNPSTGSPCGGFAGQNFILVLDDYHLLDSKPVDDALAFLLEHLPPRMHLVIATREDPHLPLARLRARGQLTELRAADLRFTPAEAAEFLNPMMGLNLSTENIAALETRTEGWIAGLQLAAVSMQGREDAAGFIKAFTGSHRFVLDYLIEEVLRHQPEHVRSFLEQTAALERFCASLCNAVTEREDGREMLDLLERGNLFLIPLDEKRQWYRYHHLFAEVLQTHRTEARPDADAALHRRASAWFERNGLRADAIRHSFAAKDFETAAGLIERAWPAEEGTLEIASWLGWVKALPEERVSARPVLNVWYAFALLGTGGLEAAEARFTAAERWLEPSDPSNAQREPASAKMAVEDKEQFDSLPAAIAVGRAFIAQALGNIPDTVRYAGWVLKHAPEGERLRRGQAAMLLGMTYWASGDLIAAGRVFSEYTLKLRLAGNIPDAISTTVVLAEIRLALGRLREAVRAVEQLMQFLSDQGGPVAPDAAELHRGLGELYLEQGNLEGASQHLRRSRELGDKAQLPVWRYHWHLAQARLMETQGDLNGALAKLDEAERLHIRSPMPDFRPVSAMKARIWIASGGLAKALEWVDERGLSSESELGYLREYEHITLARILIAQYQSDRLDGPIRAAMRLLERLLNAAEEGARMGSVIEILVLQALAHRAQGDIPPALAPLRRALALAGPEGYVRIFADEGQPMAELLKRMETESGPPQAKEHIQKISSAINVRMGFPPSGGAPAGENKPSAGSQPLIEPLSERELEVLRLLGTDLNGPEIARKCMVSLSTVRTHTQNIYAKLGVNNRRAAVRRAEELDLL